MNDIHDLLGAYCTDALDPQERTAFEEHLATCSECRDEAADFREVLAALADAHPVDPPAPSRTPSLPGRAPWVTPMVLTCRRPASSPPRPPQPARPTPP